LNHAFDLSHRKYCESLTFVGIVVVVVVVVVVATGTGRVHVFFFRGRHFERIEGARGPFLFSGFQGSRLEYPGN
jgi:hypothetical protein